MCPMSDAVRHPSEMHDRHDEWPPGVYTWLQAWYASQCDGDWEHGEGITIETLDNPGWSVRITIAGTSLEGRPFDRIEVYRTEHEWLTAWVEGDNWNAACGPLQLGEALFAFRSWAEPEQ